MSNQGRVRTLAIRIWAVALGAVMGTVFMLAPVAIGCYVYSVNVFWLLWLVGLSGAFIVPLETEPFAGERPGRVFAVAGVLVWAALMAILFTGFMPDYFVGMRWILTLAQPFIWAVEFFFAWLVGVWLVRSLRSSGKAGVWRWRARAGFVFLLALFAAAEFGVRHHALTALKPTALRTLLEFGIAVPPGAKWSARYGAVSDGLPGFEHTPFPPRCTVIATGQAWEVEAHYTGHDFRGATVTGRLPVKRPRSFDHACNVVRTCPPLKHLPILFSPKVVVFEPNDSNLVWGLHYENTQGRPLMSPNMKGIGFRRFEMNVYESGEAIFRLSLDPRCHDGRPTPN